MRETKAKLLVVDDDPAIRIPIFEFLTAIGYEVRTADHGLAGLVEIQKEAPGILLSDLNMPHMSGFELLSVVRHQFPAIKTIAMSGTVCAGKVPSGVVADAFFQKGGQLPSLLTVIKNLPLRKRKSPRAGALKPVLVQRAVHSNGAENSLTFSCPECQRTFSRPLGGPAPQVLEIVCEYCRNLVQSADLRRSGSR